MTVAWWLPTLAITLSLIVLLALASQRRYRHLRRAYYLHRDRGMDGASFLNYVLMEATDLEAASIDELSPLYMLKRKELYWKNVASASYGISSAICIIVIMLSFYGTLKAPKWVPFLFLTLLMLSAYITYRSWRYFKIT